MPMIHEASMGHTINMYKVLIGKHVQKR